MFLDDVVDFGHDADGFIESHDNLLIMLDIGFCELASSAIFQPFFTNLVTTDMEVPNVLRYAFETFGLSFVQPDSFACVRDFLNFGIATADKLRNMFIKL